MWPTATKKKSFGGTASLQASRQVMESSLGPENQTVVELAEALGRLDRQLAAGREQLQERRNQQRSAIGRLKSVRSTLSDLAWELEELEQRLSDLQAQREGPDDPLVEREVASMISRRSAFEEQLLALMLQADQLAADVAAEERALAAASEEWSSIEQALVAERAKTVALLDQQPEPHE